MEQKQLPPLIFKPVQTTPQLPPLVFRGERMFEKKGKYEIEIPEDGSLLKDLTKPIQEKYEKSFQAIRPTGERAETAKGRVKGAGAAIDAVAKAGRNLGEAAVDPEAARTALETPLGVLEGAAATATGIPAFAVSLGAIPMSLAEQAVRGERLSAAKAGEKQQKWAGAMTYKPSTEMGKTSAEVMVAPIGAVLEAREKVMDGMGLPEETKATVRIAFDAALVAGGIKGAPPLVQKVWHGVDPIAGVTRVAEAMKAAGPKATSALKNVYAGLGTEKLGASAEQVGARKAITPTEVIPPPNTANDMAILENVTGLKRSPGETYDQLKSRSAQSMTPPSGVKRLREAIGDATKKVGMSTEPVGANPQRKQSSFAARLVTLAKSMGYEVKQGTPEYDVMSMKVQTQMADELIKGNYDAAKDTAFTRGELPPELTREAFLARLAAEAAKRGDFDTVLRTGIETGASLEGTKRGQQNAMLALLRDPDNPAVAIADIVEARRSKIEKATGKTPLSAADDPVIAEARAKVAEIDRAILGAPDKPDVIAKLENDKRRVKRVMDDLLKERGAVTSGEAENVTKLAGDMIKAREEMEAGGDRLKYGAAKVSYDKYVEGLKRDDKYILAAMRDRFKMFGQEAKTNPAKAVFKLGKDYLTYVSDLSRSLVASFDNSFHGRQGLSTLMTHPKIWGKNFIQSWGDIAKTLSRKEGYDVARDAVLADAFSQPHYLDGKFRAANILGKEEMFPVSLPRKVPGVGRVYGASEVAFFNSATRARMEIFNQLYAKAEKARASDPEGWKAQYGEKYTDKDLVESIGDLANSLTGRGRTGRWSEGAFRVVIWAPKMIKANWNVLTAHSAGGGLSHPWARKEAAKNLAMILGETVGAVAMINAIRPGSVETDPRSSDFLKVKVGNTRFDLTGGKGSLLTFIGRLGAWALGHPAIKSTRTGKLTELNKKGVGDPTMFDVGIDFLANKTAPFPRMWLDTMRGQDFRGRTPTTGSMALSTFTPIAIQNFINTYYGPDKDGSVAAAVGDFMDIIGVSSSTYDPATSAAIRASKGKEELVPVLKHELVAKDGYEKEKERVTEFLRSGQSAKAVSAAMAWNRAMETWADGLSRITGTTIEEARKSPMYRLYTFQKEDLKGIQRADQKKAEQLKKGMDDPVEVRVGVSIR